MKNFLTLCTVMVIVVCLSITMTAAGIQKDLAKKVTAVDQVSLIERSRADTYNDQYTAYPVAKKKGTPMHGNYTIGATGDYINFYDALAALNADSMDGDVNLLILADYDATVNGEGFPILFKGTIPGSGTYTLKVAPNTGVTTAEIAGTFTGSLVRIDSIKKLTFENFTIRSKGGNAVSNGAMYITNGAQFLNFSNMKFKAAGNATNYQVVFINGSNTATGGVKDWTFDNCEFTDNGEGFPESCFMVRGYTIDPTTRGMVKNSKAYNFNGASTFTGTGFYVQYAVTHITFQDNEIYTTVPAGSIVAGLRGMSLGSSSSGPTAFFTITGNYIHDLTSTVATTSCYAMSLSSNITAGIQMESFLIDNNHIANINGNHATAIGTIGINIGGYSKDMTISNNLIENLGGGLQSTGIYINGTSTYASAIENVQVIGNIVRNINNADVAAGYVAGMRFGYANNLMVAKNIISNITGTVIGKYPIGIWMTGLTGKSLVQTVANNFIMLAAPQTVNGSYIVGILDNAPGVNPLNVYYNSVYIGGTNFDATELTEAYSRWKGNITDVKNNIFDNERTGAGTNVAIEEDGLGGTYTSDYNDMYSAAGTVGFDGSATLYPALSDWQTFKGTETNSKSVLPTFKTTSDLHMKIGTATTLENAGVAVAVTTDIDGATRPDGSAPDIGADEFLTSTPGAFVLVSPTSGATNVPINGNLTWTASPNTYTYDVYLDTVSSPGLVGNVTGTSYPYSGLSGSRKYYWKVGAKNDIGTVFATNSPDSFTTAALPPTAPSGITFTNVTATSLTVHWVDNSSNETGFNIYKAIGTGDYALEGTVGAGVQLFPVASLSPNVRYHFRVTAYQTVQGESNPAEDSVATLANTPLAPLAPGIITKRTMNLRPSPSDGNPAATMYAFYNSVSDQYVGSKTISGVYTYYFLSATPVWRSRTDWGAPAGTTIVNLLPSTGYTWKAKARNLDGVETILGPTLFTTTQAPLSVFPAIEGFENTIFPPTDWGRIDVAGDGTVDGTTTPATFYGMWGKATTTVYKGSGCARYLWEQTLVNGADDWLINQPMTFQSGVSYILSFYVRTSGANEKMEVTIGDAPTAFAQTTILAEYNPLYSTSYIFKGIVFTVPSTGTYYIGFHASTPTNQLWIRMDEVKVAVANPYDAAFLGLTQTTGTRPMKGMIVGEKTDNVTLSEVPFDRSNVKVNKVYRTSDVSNTLLLSGPVNTSYKLQGFAGQAEVADAFNNNNGILKGTPTSVNLRAEVANIGVNSIPGFAINYIVDGVAQPPFSGGAILPGGNIFANIPFAPTARGMFDAVAATDVVGEGDRSNDTASVALMIYPTPAYNIRYDDYYATPYYGWGTSTPNDTFRIVIGMRYTNPQRGRVGQIDITTKSNRRVGSTYMNVAIPDVWRVRVRAAGVDTNTPGPILYEKKFEGPKYNTVATTLKTMAFGDDAPVIEAGQDFWITVMAESAGVTTGGYPFGMFDGKNDVTHLLPGASYRSYGSDYLDEHSWYAMDASVMGTGDFGHWALRSIMVPVSNSIYGVVYEDKNGNGLKDSGEPALENWEVKLTNGLNLSTHTNANGIYAFNALENGTFTLSETIQPTWHCLTPDSTGSISVTLSGDESQIQNFGNYQGVKPGVDEEDLIATEYRLYQNYPNPFNPNTMIRFSIPNKGHVSLKVHNILGIEVATLVDEDLNPGTYKVSFDGSKFASGLYFYRITSNNYTATMKMLFVK
jgi:hypothetical protein